MKYVVILGDGMADLPQQEWGGKTALEVADLQFIDKLAAKGILGLTTTVPDGFPIGSDVANLSVMGYDPAQYYTGRSPLEAVSMRIPMKLTDVAFRTNIVTLSEQQPYEKKILLDHSADEISTEEASVLIDAVKDLIKSDERALYAGISYRHILVWDGIDPNFELTPPHDILGQSISRYLPGNDIIMDFMKKSYDVLNTHPVNLAREAQGLKKANSVWLWGQGRAPGIPLFKDKYHIEKGCVISAVDLIRGICLSAGFDAIEVNGATGNIHTNWSGKAEAAIEALRKGYDFVYLHIEAPDEATHRYEAENKVKSIELIDRKIVKPIFEYLSDCGCDFKMLIMPDHTTSLSIRTHTRDPVPYLIYDSTKANENDSECCTYTEDYARIAGNYVEFAHDLMGMFVSENY